MHADVGLQKSIAEFDMMTNYSWVLFLCWVAGSSFMRTQDDGAEHFWLCVSDYTQDYPWAFSGSFNYKAHNHGDNAFPEELLSA